MLLAHELAHVRQQSSAIDNEQSFTTHAYDLERDAEETARSIINDAGHTVEPKLRSGLGLARQKEDGGHLAHVSGGAEPEFEAKPACLKRFTHIPGISKFDRVYGAGPLPALGGACGFEASFGVQADFDPTCNCSELEYRQFIRGHIIQEKAGNSTDRGDLMKDLPLGRLTEVFQEDGNTSRRPVYYGHRSDPSSTRSKSKTQYTNAGGRDDQKNGCHYEAEDTAFATFYATPGDTWDVELIYRGEIQRKGKSIERRYWTAIKGRFTP
jgi:hypothetical protein